MSWHNVILIFVREVRDQLRDRRTLFMMAVLPILLYPALGIGTLNLAQMFQESPRNVLVLGAEELPREPVLLAGHRFLPEWFTIKSDASKLNVLTDTALEASESTRALPDDMPRGIRDPEFRTSLAKALPELRQKIHEREVIDREIAAAQNDKDIGRLKSLEPKRNELNAEFSSRIGRLGVQAILVVPEGFAVRLHDANSAREIPSSSVAAVPRLQLLFNSADDKSRAAESRLRDVFRHWESEILKRRLTASQLPATWTTPVNAERKDMAGVEAISAGVWSKIFPALLVVWAVTGAFYPAIDLAAGEKERGTMETLLICPAKRSEIVLGKFFTVMVFSVGTAILNLISMAFTSRYMASMGQEGALSRLGDLQPPSFGSVVWVVVLLLPLSALFSALCLSLATFARSTKEGQYYLTPMLMVTLGLTMFCMSPGAEISKFTSAAPVIGVTLLLKQVLAAPGAAESFLYAIPVLLTSIVYAGLALWWAIEQFAREDVLFREAEMFDLKLWLRHLVRDKGLTPSFAEAGLCFVMIMLLQFGAMKFMQNRIFAAAPGERNVVMMQLLMIQQVAIIAAPALFMGTILAKSPRKTFSLYWPGTGMLVAAAVLALCMHPLSTALVNQVKGFFPELSEDVKSVLQTMSDPNQSLSLLLLAFAVAPGICEELAFRGMILSGFRSNGRNGIAIAISAIAFGVMHMIPLQSFNAALLGVVLGLIAVRSGSLLPGIVFHIVFNGLQILRSRLDVDLLRHGPVSYLFHISEQGEIGFSWWTLGLAAAGAASILAWIIMRDRPSGDSKDWPAAPWTPGITPEASHH